MIILVAQDELGEHIEDFGRARSHFQNPNH